MEAKVKQNFRWNTLIAFSGREFTKYGFTKVPPEYEAAALADERLEVRQEAVKEPEVVEPYVVETEVVEPEVEPEIPEFEPPIVTDSYDPFEPVKKHRRHKKVED